MDTGASLEAYASLCETLEGEFKLLHGVLEPAADGQDSPSKCAARLAALAQKLDKLSGEETPAALCLSGGGIRSATFSLGVVESLARHGLLGKFHYLSTVSGGGYLGGWLSSWISRHPDGIDGVVRALSNTTKSKTVQAGAGDSSSAQSPSVTVASEQQPVEAPWTIERLRAYSNYLSPVWGASLDAFTLIATFLRNLWLHWTALVPILALAVVVARLPLVVDRIVAGPGLAWTAGGVSLLLIGIAVAYIGADLPGPLADSTGAAPPKNNFGWLFLAPLLVAAVLLSCVGSWIAPDPAPLLADAGRLGSAILASPWRFLATFVVCGAALYMGAAGCGMFWRAKRGLEPRSYSDRWIAIATALATGALGGGGLLGYLYLASKLTRHWTTHWSYAIYGVPALFFVFWLTLTSYVGLARRITSEDDREWWSRAAAVTLLVSISWAVFMALAVGPAEHLREQKLNNSVGLWAALSGIFTSAWGFWGKRGSTIKRSAQSIISKLGLQVLDLAALCFAVLLVVALGVLAEQMLTKLTDWALPEPHSPRAPYDFYGHLAVGIAAAMIGLVTNYLVGVNAFSLHSMYGNRIVRAYLGGTNASRQPHWFTGFDPKDNLAMASLVHFDKQARPRLFHVVNIALNLARAAGDRLEWQQRKATSFTVSPQRCGSALLGFVPTPNYARSAEKAIKDAASTTKTNTKETKDAKGGGDAKEAKDASATPPSGITLGRAVAISGAAASPNMGYHTSTLVAFAMSFFNVRLGWWLPNPRTKFQNQWEQDEPSFGLFKLLRETFAATGDDQSFVYLSDGGHFENLGLYEMVRRRCRRIVVVDASEDPDFRYGDLESAVRKIRIDLGVDIQFPHGLPSVESVRRTKRSDTVATITYPDTGATGLILYIKPSMCGDEPLDVQRYAAASRGRLGGAFPHDPTWRQAFDEAQFESYRMLGQHIADKALDVSFPWALNVEDRPNHKPNEGESASSSHGSAPAPVVIAADAPASKAVASSTLLASAVLAGAILIAGALAIRTPTLPPNVRLDTTGTSATPQDAALAQSVATLSARLNDLARAVGPAPASTASATPSSANVSGPTASGATAQPATTLVDALDALEVRITRNPDQVTNTDLRQQIIDLHQQVNDVRNSWQKFINDQGSKQIPDAVIQQMKTSSTQISSAATAIQTLVARMQNAPSPPDLTPVVNELDKIRQAIDAASPRHNISGTTAGGRQ